VAYWVWEKHKGYRLLILSIHVLRISDGIYCSVLVFKVYIQLEDG
jgi:hypothetical protein